MTVRTIRLIYIIFISRGGAFLVRIIFIFSCLRLQKVYLAKVNLFFLISFIFRPASIYTDCFLFCFRWQDCFIINPSLPFWMSAQAQLVLMWKTTFTATVER